MSITNLYIGPTKSGKTATLFEKVERLARTIKVSGTKSKIFICAKDLALKKIDKDLLKYIEVSNTPDPILVKTKNYIEVFIDNAESIQNISDYVIYCKTKGIPLNIFTDMIEKGLTSYKNISDIIPLVDNIISLKSICEKCGSPLGTFTFIVPPALNNSKKDKSSLVKTSLCLFCYCKEINYTAKALKATEEKINRYYSKFVKN